MDTAKLLDICESQKRKLKAENKTLKEHIEVLEQRIAENRIEISNLMKG